MIFHFVDDRIVKAMIRFNKPTIGKKDLESVLYCMIEDNLAPGLYLKTFTSMLSATFGIPHVAAFSSYFHALETAFHLIGGSQGDEVLIPSSARPVIVRCLLRCGLTPVPVDITSDSFLPPVGEIKRKMSSRTRCLFIPQMFGIPSDLSIYRELDLPIIEDVDGSIGSRVNGERIGSFGDYITMNFNDDSLITTGSGGMLASRDRQLKQFVDILRNDQEDSVVLMSDLNASLGVSQLGRLEKNIESRKRISGYYDDAVFASGGALVGRDEGKEFVFSSYVVATRTAFKECVQFFKKFDIPIRRGIEKPIHAILGLSARDYRNSEQMHHSLIALPIYPALSQKDIENIVKGIKAIL